jgi:hypothetical protein
VPRPRSGLDAGEHSRRIFGRDGELCRVAPKPDEARGAVLPGHPELNREAEPGVERGYALDLLRVEHRKGAQAHLSRS